MRRIIGMAFLVVTVIASQLGGGAQALPGQARQQAKQPAQPEQLEQEFIKLEREWMEAVRKQDDSTLDRLMANDFIHTTTNLPGIKSTKAQFIEMSILPTTRMGSFSMGQVAVQLVGDTAVVNALHSQKVRQGELNLSGDYFITDIWVRRKNRWQVVARNLMSVPKTTIQSANQQVNVNERGTTASPPCLSGCREQFAATTKLCRVKASNGEKDAYEYDMTCMQKAQKGLKSCNAGCQTENAKSEAGRQIDVPAPRATSKKP